MKMYLCIVWIVALAASASAAEGNSERDTPEPKEPATPELSRQDEYRDPFWPVGYDPETARIEAERGGKSPDEIAAEEDKLKQNWGKAQAMLKISGLSRMGDQGYFAIVNGQMLRAGDTVSIEIPAGMFVWKIVDISSDGVKLRRLQVRDYKKNKK